MKRVSASTYRKDPLFPRIERTVTAILAAGDVVAPVDVLVRMDILRREQVDEWRAGRVPYLERVIQGSLPRLSRLLRILALHAHALGLEPSTTVYVRWGKEARERLRFSKTSDPNLEAAYSRHFVRKQRSSPAPRGRGEQAPEGA
jgi:hypothetical protein